MTIDVTETVKQATPSAELAAILERLVGQKSPLTMKLPDAAVRVLSESGSGIGYSQLNELLLLLGFDRVTHAFFQFLIDGTTEYQPGAAIKSVDELKAGVDRLRELALLVFGNVKYGFKVLSTNIELLEQRLEAQRPISPDEFALRHDPIRPVQTITPERTYYLGYMIERELQARLKSNPEDLEARAQESERVRLSR